MKCAPLLSVFFAAMLPLHAGPGKAPQPDPLAGAFFPPDLVMREAERICLTAEQRETIRARIGKDQARFEEMRKRLESEAAALGGLAKEQRVDEGALAAQLDKLLDAEREVKHGQISLLAAIKNLLTPEQQAKLGEVAKSGFVEETRKRIEGKIAKVKEGARKWAEGGRDPSEIARAMEGKFKPLIESGNIPEAEAELDRVLEQLMGEQKQATTTP
ncbi:MAG: hypothetical protein WC003_01785 [Terrimicrobiaceae bacterium]